MDQDQIRAYRALQKVARQEGVSFEQVIQNIEEAILEAHSNAKRTGNQEALAAWNRIPCKGSLPTALELVSCLGHQLASMENILPKT